MVIGCDSGYVFNVTIDPVNVTIDPVKWAFKYRLISQHELHEGSAVKIVKTGKNFVQDQVISGEVDGTIRVWSLKDHSLNMKLFEEDSKSEKAHNGHVNSICFSKDVEIGPGIKTDVIVSVSSDKLIKIWNYGTTITIDNKKIKKGELIQSLGETKDGGHTDIITSVDISYDNERHCHIIVTCSHDSSIKIWNVPDKKFKFELLSSFKDPRNPTEKFNSVALSKPNDKTPDGLISPGQLIVSGSSCSGYGYVKLWDTHGDVIHTYIGQNRDEILPASHNNAVLSVAFSPDCSKVASSGSDFKVKCWSISEHPAIKDYLKNMQKNKRSYPSPSPI